MNRKGEAGANTTIYGQPRWREKKRRRGEDEARAGVVKGPGDPSLTPKGKAHKKITNEARLFATRTRGGGWEGKGVDYKSP